MVVANMSIAVHVMIIILKQQELDVEEVTATIYSYINQFCRSELRFFIPEMRGILVGLLQKHLKGTKHLENVLGEDHPVAMIWTQRVDQLLEVANEALHLSYIVLMNSEGTAEAQAAGNLPLGNVASGPQAVQAESGKLQVEAQAAPAVSGKLHAEAQAAADSVLPATDQVIISSVEYNDAAANLPIGNVDSGPQAVQAETGKLHVEAQAAADSVQQATDHVAPAESGCQCFEEATQSRNGGRKQATQPSQILDRCLAQASAAAEKLHRLSASQAKVVTPVMDRVHPTNQGHLAPRDQLDAVLTEASSALRRLDSLMLRVSCSTEPANPKEEISSQLISSVTPSDIPGELVGSSDTQTGKPAEEDQQGGRESFRQSTDKGAPLRQTQLAVDQDTRNNPGHSSQEQAQPVVEHGQVVVGGTHEDGPSHQEHSCGDSLHTNMQPECTHQWRSKGAGKDASHQFLAQTVTATQAWVTGDIAAENDSPARRTENADSQDPSIRQVQVSISEPMDATQDLPLGDEASEDNITSMATTQASARTRGLDQPAAAPHILQVSASEKMKLDTAEILPIGAAVNHVSLVRQMGRNTDSVPVSIQSEGKQEDSCLKQVCTQEPGGLQQGCTGKQTTAHTAPTDCAKAAAVPGPQAIVTIQPAAPQEFITTDTDTATRPHAAPTEDCKHHEAEAPSVTQTADTVQPEVMHVCKVKTNEPAANLPDKNAVTEPDHCVLVQMQHADCYEHHIRQACCILPSIHQAGGFLHPTQRADSMQSVLLPAKQADGVLLTIQHTDCALFPIGGEGLSSRGREVTCHHFLQSTTEPMAREATCQQADQVLQFTKEPMAREGTCQQAERILQSTTELMAREATCEQAEQILHSTTELMAKEATCQQAEQILQSTKELMTREATCGQAEQILLSTTEPMAKEVTCQEAEHVLQFTTEPMAREVTCQQVEQVLQFTTKPMAREVACQQKEQQTQLTPVFMARETAGQPAEQHKQLITMHVEMEEPGASSVMTQQHVPHQAQKESNVLHPSKPGSNSRQTAHAQQSVTDIHALGREEAETNMITNKAAAAAECLDQPPAPSQVLQSLSSRGIAVTTLQSLCSRGSLVTTIQSLCSRGSPVTTIQSLCTQADRGVQELICRGSHVIRDLQQACTQWELQESPDRSLQIINCRVSDLVAIQPGLGCDLQVHDSTDRGKHAGLQAGHQILDHTSKVHSSNVPDKRNKVNQPKEYLTSLMMEKLPL